MWDNLHRQHLKPFFLIGIAVVIQLVVWGLSYFDTVHLNNDGFIKGLHIKNIGWLLKGILFLFVLPAVIFRAAHSESVKLTCSNIFIFSTLLLFLEGCSFTLVKTSVVNVIAPNYSRLRLLEYSAQATPFYAEYKKEWGTWHYAKRFRHKSSCFDVTYTRNEVGARDQERAIKTDQTRFLFLGDSYIEGYCVDDTNRLSDQLEKQTNLEHLNFGISATSPTQYYLVYKHLAKQYQHDAVVIGLLPWNDFLPDDYERAIRSGSGVEHNYRPYWVGTYPNYKLTYYIKNLEDSDWYPSNMERVFKRDYIIGNTTQPYTQQLNFFLLNHSYTYRVIKHWLDIVHSQMAPPPVAETSPFWKYRPQDLQRVTYSLERISQEAGNKKIFILGLPILNDLKVRQSKGEVSPLSKQLQTICQDKNWVYVDLLEYFYKYDKNWDSYYLPCDGHWSPKGHQLAAKALFQNQAYQQLVNTIK